MVLHAAGLQHKRSHRRHALAELAGDQPQRLPPAATAPTPRLVLLWTAPMTAPTTSTTTDFTC
jgi:hypothetical protein